MRKSALSQGRVAGRREGTGKGLLWPGVLLILHNAHCIRESKDGF
jgi:hypothetical protein